MKLKNPEVRIENSSKCNANCISCPREKMTRKKMVMPNQQFMGLVDQSKDLGAEMISVFGYGEPLLDKCVDEKVEYCTQSGLKTFITTNAALLTTEMAARLFAAGLTHLRISAHGIWFNYNRVHRGLDFQTLLRNTANAIKMNEIRFGHPTKIDITAIPMHDEPVGEIIAFWKDFNIDGLEVWRPHNWAGGRSYRKVKKKKKTCGRPFNGPVQINADGKMMVCCFDTDATMVVGDTNKNTIEEVLKGDAFNRIRKAHTTGNMKGLICKNCDQLNEYHESPLLYSTEDPTCECGKTSSMKVKLEA